MSFPTNIFLTGFMGSGKSTLGKKLSLRLGYEFADLDTLIEKEAQLSIHSIFEKNDEVYFRELEKKCLNDLLNRNDKLIVSLGGGTVCFYDNLDKIKNKGLLLYLYLPPKVLYQRLIKNVAKRPVLNNLTGEPLQSLIESKLKEREIYYNLAHITINGLRTNTDTVQQHIFDYYQNKIQ